MSDTQVNQFDAKGTTADRMGFTPNPPTPASGPDNGYVFYDTDDGTLYCWDGSAWQPCIIGGAGTVTNTGTLTSGKTIVGNGGVDVTVSSLTAAVVSASSGTLAAAGDAVTTRAITFAIDGGGSALTTGIKADVYVPYACTITAVTMLADQSGSVVVDIWKDTLANYPPTIADTIVASAPPTISSATNSSDTTLTGWTTSISAGDTLRFNVNSATSITRLDLTLKVAVS